MAEASRPGAPEEESKAMKNQTPDSEALLKALKDAVAQTLERKRKLGHYAVIWEQGEIRMAGEDAPVMYGYPEASPMRDHWIEEDDD